MLAAEGEKPAEDDEAAEAGQSLCETADRPVERISLDDARGPDSEPDRERDTAREPPGIGAAETEIVEHVTGVARDVRAKESGTDRRNAREQ